MPEAALSYETTTTAERIADGSLRIEFQNPDGKKLPESTIQILVGDYIRTHATVDEYRDCVFEICIGDTQNDLGKEIEFFPVRPGTRAVPFVIGSLSENGTRFKSRRYGLRPMCGGELDSDMLERLCVSSVGNSVNSSRADAASPKVVPMHPISFEPELLRNFFSAFLSQCARNMEQPVTDATLRRLYAAVDPTTPMEQVARCVEALVERNFFTRKDSRLKEFTLGPAASMFIETPTQSPEPPSQTANSDLALAAKAIKKAKRLEAELESAQAEIAELKQQLATQPDIQAQIDAGIRAGLAELLGDD